jgi:hypothetical protein
MPLQCLASGLLGQRIAELKSRIPVGRAREAVIRGLIYAGLGRAAIDERGFEIARRLKGISGISSDLPDLMASAEPTAASAIHYFVYRVALNAGMLAAALAMILVVGNV